LDYSEIEEPVEESLECSELEELVEEGLECSELKELVEQGFSGLSLSWQVRCKSPGGKLAMS